MPAPSDTQHGSGPMFSVLIAAYASETTIAETLDSLLAQSLADWEAIVVDDGSGDRTGQIALGYASRDTRITVRSQENLGAAVARNTAAAAARGRWYLPLDADDLLLPEALKSQAAFMHAHPGFDIYSWGILMQLQDGSRTPWRVSAAHDGVEEFTLGQLVRGNLLTAMTVVSADLFERSEGFRNVRLEDYDFWLRAFAAGGRHIHNPQMLAVYRQSASSKNADLGLRWLGTAEVLAALADDESVDVLVRRSAARGARYWRAVDDRRNLELRLLAGDYRHARADYWRARRAFESGAKWTVGLVIMMLSPAAFTRVVRPAPVEESLNVG